MMTLTRSNFVKTVALSFMLMFTLIGCADSANYAVFRESLDPLYAEIEIGMSDDEVLTVLKEYPEVINHEYSYTAENGSEFGLDEAKVVDGLIYQLTMAGDPAEAGVSSICFVKVLFVNDGSGGKHVIEVNDVSCPA